MRRDKISRLVDKLGAIKSRIATDRKEETKILKELKTHLRPGAYEGELFRVTLSESERTTYDIQRMKVEIPDVLVSYEKTTTVQTIRVTARTGEDLDNGD